MKKTLILIITFISIVWLSSAINIVLNSGQKLDSNNWNDLSLILNKVNVSGDNLSVNGKLAINGKICLEDGTCLGECEAEKHWNSGNTTCENNTRLCSIENGVGSQTWNTTTNSWNTCNLTNCNSGYHVSGNTCVINEIGTVVKFDMNLATASMSSDLKDTYYCGTPNVAKLFDGDLNTCNSGNRGNYNPDIFFNFENQKYIGKVIWKTKPGNSQGGIWGSGEPANSYIKIYGSANNINWTEIGSYGPFQDSPNGMTITVNSSMDLPFKYFKVSSRNNDGHSIPLISELEIYGFDGPQVDYVIKPIVKFDMTGVTASISSDLQDTYYCGTPNVAKLFDGDLNTCNSGNRGNVTPNIYFNFSNKKYVSKIIRRTKPENSSGGMWGSGDPTSAYVRIYGSNDNSNWREIGVYGPYNDGPNGMIITVTCAIDTPYQYYKVESRNDNGHSIPLISELEVYGFNE